VSGDGNGATKYDDNDPRNSFHERLDLGERRFQERHVFASVRTLATASLEENRDRYFLSSALLQFRFFHPILAEPNANFTTVLCRRGFYFGRNVTS
jgi:hypothetical protein